MRNLLLLILACCLLTGCYRLDIQQGNVITPTMIAKLKPGMSKAQVQEVLGAPVLTSVFATHELYYVYTFKPGHGHMTSKHLTVYFSNDRMTHYRRY